MMIDWRAIDTLLLDMDGTLLDLHFDNYFWREYLPVEYARHYGEEPEQVREYLFKLMDETYGTIDWYCLDFWTKKLGLDIVSLKREVDHLIDLRPSAKAFLEAAHRSHLKVYLITNAHHDALDLKLEKASISHYFDELISSHQFGYIKEQQEFWHTLTEHLNFDKSKALFIDDSRAVLDSAKTFGIGHILEVSMPDSKAPARDSSPYPLLHDFSDIMPELNDD